jgi:hypothetical protein
MNKKSPPDTFQKLNNKIEPATPVIRLRIEVADGNWNVIKQIRIPKMTLPKQPDLPILKDKPPSGFWAELIDSKGKLLYRVFKNNPLTGTKEVIDKKGKYVRESMSKDSVIFDVLIPEHKNMDKLRFYTDIDSNKDFKAGKRRNGSFIIKEISLK